MDFQHCRYIPRVLPLEGCLGGNALALIRSPKVVIKVNPTPVADRANNPLSVIWQCLALARRFFSWTDLCAELLTALLEAQ